MSWTDSLIFLGIRERATPVFRLGEHVVIGGQLRRIRSGQNAKCIVRRDAFGRHRMGPFVSLNRPHNRVPLRLGGCLDRYFLGSARVVSRRSLRRVSGVRERLERARTTWLHTVPGAFFCPPQASTACRIPIRDIHVRFQREKM